MYNKHIGNGNKLTCTFGHNKINKKLQRLRKRVPIIHSDRIGPNDGSSRSNAIRQVRYSCDNDIKEQLQQVHGKHKIVKS